ncbi:hypothetical protein DSM43518_02029 [Mycobacterium marinum]|uniref:hypothetical protein n=1 Tax=Mycobacterium marinum TaxID=1781 RepID=UPI000E3BE118|nr:hypothetical protein [Mycobacterium marinum]RFZ11189.1 hypothetical protein DSM43518_02029 [Mycobacterium marinum]RFZ15021.1 hypothetical protein VIMS_02451 [Mycobacterium marinum]
MSYRVIAPLVLAKDSAGRTHHRYEGSVIDWLSPDQTQHLLGLGMIEAIGAASANPASPAPADSPEKPKQVAPKADWIDYAVNGAPVADRISESEAEAMTKAELVEMFG